MLRTILCVALMASISFVACDNINSDAEPALEIPVDSYATCSALGFWNFRQFDASRNDNAQLCNGLGSHILLKNAFVKVSAHNYIDWSTKLTDWSKIKIFIEFFDGLTKIPIALINSDMFAAECAFDCVSSSPLVRDFGLNGSISLITRKEQGTVVAFIWYKKADLKIILRRGYRGWNFAVKMLQREVGTRGQCNSGCDLPVARATFDNFVGPNLKIGQDVCTNVLEDLPLGDARDTVIAKCAFDLASWQDVSAALDHRWFFIDSLLIDRVWSGGVDSKSSAPLQSFPLIDLDTLYKLTSYIKPVVWETAMNVSIVAQQLHSDVSESSATVILPDIDAAAADVAVDATIPDDICKSERPGIDKDVLYLAYPNDSHKYIQCDQDDKYFIKTCPENTVFSENLVCAKIEILKLTKTKTLLEFTNQFFSRNARLFKPRWILNTKPLLVINKD